VDSALDRVHVLVLSRGEYHDDRWSAHIRSETHSSGRRDLLSGVSSVGGAYVGEDAMKRTANAAGIVHYKDHKGMQGKLLGVITFTDGKSLKVWDVALHASCQQMARFPVGEVRYSFKHSEKWGDSLVTIERTLADHELYDQARSADEVQGRSHKQGGFIARQISKSVQKTVDADRTHEHEMKRVG
jgi:hypothetical protein